LTPLPALVDLLDGDHTIVGPHGADGLPAQLELEAAATPGVPLSIRMQFSRQEHLDIRADRDRGVVELDRNHASTDLRAAGGTTQIVNAFEDDGPAHLRVFLDGSVLEVFTSAGRVATMRCYPTAPPPYRVEVTGGDTDAVRLWHLGTGQTLIATVETTPAPAGNDRRSDQELPAEREGAGRRDGPVDYHRFSVAE
jgi:hypothetical protein